ncbi:hypothetical protein U4E84_11550 [Halorubrum sp. AD140]|uniref:hypothetical protein n=1 Tax=Halorubrum sp. AD140 TaxID=3050073 RepID=UPI002ACC4E4E|nr:hypothetical protein [Halorubrum sp. AD140]MDZ5811977.1 hypothetical protein [Halorubrum sp. AD140]
MNRRRFALATGATAGLAAGPGCLGALGPAGLHLGGVVLVNRRSERVETQLRVTRDGSTVLDERHTLAAADEGDGSGVFRNDAWADRIGVYEVRVDVASGPSEAFRYTRAHRDGTCTIARVGIREETVAFGSHRATAEAPCRPDGEP